MGQQNVYVCKIKKNKPFAPPSEKYFLLCFETKKAFPKIKYLFKNRLENFDANCYRNEKKSFSFPEKYSENFFENDFVETRNRTENPPAPMFNRTFDLSAPHATSKAIIAV